MFGLTRREQRWKAEQQAAEVVLGFSAAVVQAAANVRAEEAKAKAQADALEVERLRLKVAELERKLEVPNNQINGRDACGASQRGTSDVE